MFMLVAQSGKHQGRRVKLPKGQVLVGRDEQARVRVASSEVSREHCLLFVTDHDVRVRDLKSRNGTYVNGAPIEGEAVLAPGDKLTVGPMTFALESLEPVARKPAAAATPPAVPVAAHDAERKSGEGLSDAEITAWLSDEPGGLSASDTTITGMQLDPPPAARKTPHSVSIPPAARRQFRSVAEEARDIIRRHLELQQAGPQDE